MSSKQTSNGIAIKVEHVGKTFEPQSSSRTIKEGFVGLGRKLTGKKPSKHHKGEYTALKDISFEVKKGEFFGIVGRNGSGKSTLLKILAGVYTPTKGNVQVNGKLTPFIELGVGFNPELSGRDNVFLNGALLGFTRQQMLEMYDDIVDFAELHDFMDTKLKNYSSGMQVRLAFSVAIRAKSEVLLIDEVLAVGDANFQKKCFDYFALLKKDKRTVILVSHDMEAVKQYCDSVALINNGLVEKIGDALRVTEIYNAINVGGRLEKSNKRIAEQIIKKSTGTRIIDIKSIDNNGKTKNKITSDDKKIIIEIRAKAEEAIHSPTFGLVIEDENRQPIFATNTPTLNTYLRDVRKGEEIAIRFVVDNIFTDGIYWLSGAISNAVDMVPRKPYDRVEKINTFSISGRLYKASMTHPGHYVVAEKGLLTKLK